MTLRALLIPVAAVALAGAAAAQPAPERATRTCFNTGSSVVYKPVDQNTILVRDGRRIYRIGVNQCHNLTGIQPVIINVLHGSTQVCGPLDLQLTVLDGPHGIPEPCIAESVVQLTPEEIAAIPKRDQP